MAIILVLGAELQAATSIAGAYPERAVTFVSDQAILDGADLPNVTMTFGKPEHRAMLMRDAGDVIALCPRWLEPQSAPPLSRLFGEIERHFPGRMLPVFERPHAEGRWILKGDRWHRPDAPLSGTWQQLADVTDPHGCGLVYQAWVESAATIMAVGRRARGTQLGCVQISDERFFWDNILQAAETIDAPDIVTATLEILDALDYRGYFSLNWLRTAQGLRLSSLRPVPRAVFQLFRKGGIDLFDDTAGVRTAKAGLRMVAMPTYVSYRRLGP